MFWKILKWGGTLVFLLVLIAVVITTVPRQLDTEESALPLAPTASEPDMSNNKRFN